MKNFLQGVVEWKTWAALCFSGMIIIYTLIAALLGQSEIPISWVFSFLILASGGSFFQYLAFGPRLIKQMHYTLRLLVFAVPFFALLAATAYFFQWLPGAGSGPWLIFILIALVVFVVMTLAFEVAYKLTGKKYDGLLGQYHQRREENRKK
ncbi:MAG: hypothetical protein FWD99_00760 [Oscillospiraceae bacterium]|nr:hypothetical protein [Oscillospiraceae bacterium]